MAPVVPHASGIDNGVPKFRLLALALTSLPGSGFNLIRRHQD
jgi:hypothetical protein